MVAKRLQTLDVGLRRRMLIHVEVHCRSEEYRCFHGKIGGDEHVVGNAVCHLAQCACRTRGYQHGVSPKTEIDVGVPCAVALCKELADDGFVGQCRQGDGSDELLSCRGDDHLYFSSLFHQSADDEACLIGGNASRNA